MSDLPRSLRKEPTQERSRLMVERILEAARAVLAEEGYERASTNRVASRAGISPGSLYQYFPDKQAVLSGVIDRYARELGDELTAVLADRLDLPPDDLVRAAYDGLLDVLEEHREYLRLVTRELPVSRVAGHVDAAEQRVAELVGAYLTVSRTPTPWPPAATAWLLVRMVEHLAVDYVLQRPELDRDVFVDELVHLTQAHLVRP
ncbi:MAG: TetR/AcrR family transcriptional regulator [Propionibacteriales bacterium]|nr:TetR/AcrR family transcriptional regulator [Propionibacteriales bacterium]